MLGFQADERLPDTAAAALSASGSVTGARKVELAQAIGVLMASLQRCDGSVATIDLSRARLSGHMLKDEDNR